MVNKSRYKPFYKQFLRLRKNIQDRSKLFRLKKQKWVKFQQYSKNQLKFHKRFKVKDQFQLVASKFASRGNSFKRMFKDDLHKRKAFSLFYGRLNKGYVKTHLVRFPSVRNGNHKLHDPQYRVLKFFESRLDTVLYRANFSRSIEGAGQLILHGHVWVNGRIVKTKSHILKENDLVEINHTIKSRRLVKKSLNNSNFWPIPPKHLAINYRSLQILFLYSDTANLMPVFNHYLNINSVLAAIRRH